MKKSGLLLALLMLVAGCTKDADSTVEGNITRVSFRSESGASRTVTGDDGMNTKWQVGDKVALWASADGADALAGTAFEVTAVESGQATFSADIKQMQRGTYKYYSVYPTPQSISGHTATFAIPSVQNGSYDCSRDILVATPAEAIALTQKGCSLAMSYTHALHAINVVTPDGADAFTSVSLTFPSAVAGTLTLDVTGAVAPSVSGSNTVTVNFPSGARSAWIMFIPSDFTGSDITVTANTASQGASFTVAGRNFAAGHYTKLSIKMPDEKLNLEGYATLIDNNTSNAVTESDAFKISAILSGVNYTDIVKVGAEYTKNGGQPVKVYSTSTMTSETATVTVSGLTSGIYTARLFVEKSNGEEIYSGYTGNLRIVGVPTVTLGKVRTSYDYYVESGADAANGVKGTSAYTSDNSTTLSSEFYNAVTEAGVIVDSGSHTGVFTNGTFNAGEVTGLSLAAHAVKAYIVIGGIKFYSVESTIHVTGIPYSCDFTGQSDSYVSGQGWTFSSYTYKSTGLAKKLTMSGGSWGAKQFCIPGSVNIAYDFGLGSYGFGGTNTFTIGLASSAGEPTVQTASFSDGKNVYTHVVSHSMTGSVTMLPTADWLSLKTASNDSYAYTVSVKYK